MNEPTESVSVKGVQVLFISGCIHSGSTLLARLLNSSEDVFAAGEVNSLRGINFADKGCACGAPTIPTCSYWSRVRDHLLADPAAGWDLALVSTDLQQDGPRYRDFITAIRRTADVRLVVDASKDPRLSMKVARNPAMTVYTVLLYKEPRAQAASLMRKGATLKAAISSYWKVNLRSLSARPFGSRGCVLAYERLCNDPDSVIKGLCAACGAAPPDLGRIDWSAQELHLLDGNRMRFERDLVIRHDEAWRKRLTTAEAVVIKIACSPVQALLRLAEHMSRMKG